MPDKSSIQQIREIAAKLDGQNREINRCKQNFNEGSFSASGVEGTRLQTEIIKYNIKINAVVNITAYLFSAFLGLLATIIIVATSGNQSSTANMAVIAFVVLALGMSGYTRFFAKTAKLEVAGSNER